MVVALLLNHVRLAPGEAVWMPAGNLHAYLRGAGVEIMAASDNVLRGGLTPKHVDVAELLRVLRFEVLRRPGAAPRRRSRPGVVTWPVPVGDFALYRVELDGTRPPTRCPAPGRGSCSALAGEVDRAPTGHGTPADGDAPATAAFAAGRRRPDRGRPARATVFVGARPGRADVGFRVGVPTLERTKSEISGFA